MHTVGPCSSEDEQTPLTHDVEGLAYRTFNRPQTQKSTHSVILLDQVQNQTKLAVRLQGRMTASLVG